MLKLALEMRRERHRGQDEIREQRVCPGTGRRPSIRTVVSHRPGVPCRVPVQMGSCEYRVMPRSILQGRQIEVSGGSLRPHSGAAFAEATSAAQHSRRQPPPCGFSLCPCSGTTVGSGSRTPGSHSEVACWDPSPAATIDQRNNSKVAVKSSGGPSSIGAAHSRLDSVPVARKEIRLVALELGPVSPGGRRAPIIKSSR